MPSQPSTIFSTCAMSEMSVWSTSSICSLSERAGAIGTRSERRRIGYAPRNVWRSVLPMPPPAPVISTRCIAVPRRYVRSILTIAGERVALLGEHRMHPIDDGTDTGGATQIAMDDDPVFGGDLRNWR